MMTNIISYLTKVKEIVNHAIEHTEEKAPVIVTHPGMGTNYIIKETAENCCVRYMDVAPYNSIDKLFLFYKQRASEDPQHRHVLIVENIDMLCHPEWEKDEELARTKYIFTKLVENRPYNMTVIGISYGLYNGLDTEAFEIHNEF